MVLHRPQSLGRWKGDGVLVELQLAQAGHITERKWQACDSVLRDSEKLERRQAFDLFGNRYDAILADIENLKRRKLEDLS